MFKVVDNVTGMTVRGGMLEEHAIHLCRGLNLAFGPGGRYAVRDDKETPDYMQKYADLRTALDKFHDDIMTRGIRWDDAWNEEVIVELAVQFLGALGYDMDSPKGEPVSDHVDITEESWQHWQD